VASSKREKDLARQRAERQAARRAEAARRRRRRNAIVASVAAVVLVVGVATVAALTLGGDDTSDSPDVAAQASPSAAASAKGTASPGAAQAASCQFTKTEGEPSRKVNLPPAEGVPEGTTYDATLTTSQGAVAFTIDSTTTPCAAASFVSLAKQDFYADTPCHRLTSGGLNVLQCGDPTGTGTGGPGYRFADEALEGATYPAGTVAMANAGPDTNGSQFFLVYADSQLGPQYTPFGKITKGLDVLQKIAKAGVEGGGGDGKPALPVQIQSVTVTPLA